MWRSRLRVAKWTAAQCHYSPLFVLFGSICGEGLASEPPTQTPSHYPSVIPLDLSSLSLPPCPVPASLPPTPPIPFLVSICNFLSLFSGAGGAKKSRLPLIRAVLPWILVKKYLAQYRGRIRQGLLCASAAVEGGQVYRNSAQWRQVTSVFGECL